MNTTPVPWATRSRIRRRTSRTSLSVSDEVGSSSSSTRARRLIALTIWTILRWSLVRSATLLSGETAMP